MTCERWTYEELARFRATQSLAYRCAEEVAASLTPGVTEREAARRLGVLLREGGATAFFHVPLAWFGDRTGFYGFPTPTNRRPLSQIRFSRAFYPGDRRLEEGMPAILDVAPVVDGYAADIGYAFCLGDNPVLTQAKRDLAAIRPLILDAIRAERTMRAVYDEVDVFLADHGYEAAHKKYPSNVLGHKVGRIKGTSLPELSLFGFDFRALAYLAKQIGHAVVARGKAAMPLWNGTRASDRPVEPGLWALEPHIRKSGVGAKWEELLVVTDADVYWLDDDLPHHREWRQMGLAA